MANANSMTTEELLEYAALDAFGLLDEYEAALYTRSFHNAPAPLQDQIIEYQAKLVTDDIFIPSSENPNPELRSKVLDAVNTAIEQETAQFEPLATIGRNRAAAAEIAGRISFTTSHYWRAAAFALAAGLIVVSYFLARISAQHNEIARIALLLNTNIQVESSAELEKLIGPTFKDYVLDPNFQKVSFQDAGSASGARAVLLIIEGSDKAFLLVDGLPLSAQPYSLSVRYEDGSVEDMKAFESNGQLMGMHVALNKPALKNVAWEIRNPAGQLLLASA